MNWQQVKPLLYPGQDVAIMVHERPDGDALGSALGLALVLQQLGMNAQVLRTQPMNPVFAFLPGQALVKVIPKGELQLPKNGAVFVLDCGDIARCEYFLGNKRPLVNIDHHITNPYFGILNWVDPKAAATAEVIWQILYEEGIPISPQAATCFYLALITDTGWFRFENTSWRTMACASDLIRQGADLKLIRQEFAESHPIAEFDLMREATNRCRLILEGQAIMCSLPYEVLQGQGLVQTETDNVLELMRSLKGVEAAALLREIEPNVVKISIRTKSRINAAELASQLAGGGHIRAAGCTYQGALELAEKTLVQMFMQALSDK
jgi:phosphoesterase RecJ-like protein